MAGQVVQNDDVSGSQFGDQNFIDAGLEGGPIDGAHEYERGDESAKGQRTDEGRRLQVMV